VAKISLSSSDYMGTLLKDIPFDSIPAILGGGFQQYNEQYSFNLAESGPLHYAEAPLHYAEAPLHYADAPLYYAEAPLYYAEAPLHYAEAPPSASEMSTTVKAL
jgi:hypothetical protein